MLGEYPITAAIPASDLARAKRFYADTLGLKVIDEGPEGVQFESGGIRVDVYPTRASTGEATVAGWHVDDLDAEMQDLRNRGVQFESTTCPT